MSQFKQFGFPDYPHKRAPNQQRRAHLEKWKAVRNENPHRELEWGAPMLAIPPLDWAVLKVRFPDLISPDHEIKKRAWNKFLASPLSEPYRSKERSRILRPIRANLDGDKLR